jgi:hypothetical protein
MTANLVATFSSVALARAAFEALAEQGFERNGMWMASEPVPTLEVRGAKRAIELAEVVLRSCHPVTLNTETHTMPEEGFEVASSAHTDEAKTANDQWRRARADLADEPTNWAESRKQVRYANAKAGEDGFGGQVGESLGSSMRDRHVAVRNDEGPRTLTGKK